MEPVACICAAIPSVTQALNEMQTLLRDERCRIELRMIASEGLKREMRGRRLRRVQTDEERKALVDALQRVHPICHRNGGAGIALAREVVPARPHRLALR